MLSYTTGYHLLIKLVVAFGGMFAAILPAWLITEFVAVFGMPREYDAVPFMIVWLACVGIAIKLIDKYQATLDAISSYLYIRATLGTEVDFNEAKALSFLFCEDEEGKWYPMLQIRKLPKPERKEYLFTFADRVIESYRLTT